LEARREHCANRSPGFARDTIKSGAVLPFSVLSLRYINGFGQDLLEGRDINRFSNEVLGISLLIPDAITKHIPKGSIVKPQVQFLAPLNGDSSLAFLLGEGLINQDRKVILDITITHHNPIPADLDQVMALFVSSRNTIHQMFLELIRPIYEKLDPVEGSNDA
jgi:uncharacterized protein (TIGR04255 family)